MLAGDFRRHVVGKLRKKFGSVLCWQVNDHTDIFSREQLVEFHLNNTTNLRPLYALCRNGDRIVTTDSATSLHPTYIRSTTRVRRIA